MSQQQTPEQIIAEQKENCPFCKIASGQIPAEKIYEDEVLIAIADINPIGAGHLLVFPKEHYPLMQMMPPEIRDHFFSKIGYLSKGQRDGAVLLNNVWFIAGGAAAGQRTPHFMLHLLPENQTTSELFTQKHIELVQEQVNQLGGALQQHLGGTQQQGQQPTQQSPISEEQRAQLAKRLQEDKELFALITQDPTKAAEKIHEDHELSKLFAGVDITALSGRLSQAGGGQ